MGRKSVRNRLKDNRGQNLVEFALVVPMLLILVFGIAEFGRAWMTRNILVGAAREAVRIMAVQTGNAVIARNRADNVLQSAGINTGYSVDINDAVSSFETVSVTITYDLPIVVVGFIPGLDNSVITLSSRTSMRREY